MPSHDQNFSDFDQSSRSTETTVQRSKGSVSNDLATEGFGCSGHGEPDVAIAKPRIADSRAAQPMSVKGGTASNVSLATLSHGHVMSSIVEVATSPNKPLHFVSEGTVPLKDAKRIGEALSTQNLHESDIKPEMPPLRTFRWQLKASSVLSWPIVAVLISIFIYTAWANLKYYFSQYSFDKSDTSKQTVLDDKTLDNEGQILAYDFSQLTMATVLFRFFGYGSFFIKKKLLKQVLGYLAFWLALTFFFGYVVHFFPPQNDGPISKLSTLFMGTMPFFLAMYINTAFNRWWTMLTGGLGGVWQNVNQLCFLMASHLEGEQHKDKRDAMLRYGLLAQELLYQTLRKNIDIPYLLSEGLLDESEAQAITDLTGPKCHAVWIWIQDLWTRLYRDKHIEWWLLQQAQCFTTEGRRACKSALTHVNCKLPYGWVHLMTCLVNINCVLLTVKTSAFSASSGSSILNLYFIGENPCHILDDGGSLVCGGESFRAIVSILCQVTTITATTFLYLGFLELGNELADPFGTDCHDFPRFAWMAGMRKENSDYFALAGKGTYAPVKPKSFQSSPATQ
eukprot:gnl/MRDRNA2_/MRDRNA2_71491_c0_seq2.p1 gnl/MRDRNA2_/MRDRNA2_71491_c0~~gnl/MRDRNA2_/MRDRNA2_71491_c0_seq2.p1  ORF type:complete len:587 (+),score=69.65 gnl/MRDRNA2_/MRDRNA2_71491_c0_seq2:67-1761(+)